MCCLLYLFENESMQADNHGRETKSTRVKGKVSPGGLGFESCKMLKQGLNGHRKKIRKISECSEKGQENPKNAI